KGRDRGPGTGSWTFPGSFKSTSKDLPATTAHSDRRQRGEMAAGLGARWPGSSLGEAVMGISRRVAMVIVGMVVWGASLASLQARQSHIHAMASNPDLVD